MAFVILVLVLALVLSAVEKKESAWLIDRLTGSEEGLAYLPPAWIGQNIFSYAQWLACGYVVNCPESAATDKLKAMWSIVNWEDVADRLEKALRWRLLEASGRDSPWSRARYTSCSSTFILG